MGRGKAAAAASGSSVEDDAINVIGEGVGTISGAFVVVYTWDFAAPGQVMPEENVTSLELPRCEGLLFMVICQGCGVCMARWGARARRIWRCVS